MRPALLALRAVRWRAYSQSQDVGDDFTIARASQSRHIVSLYNADHALTLRILVIVQEN